MFPEGNVPGYVCNPGSPRERDAASQGHTYGIPTRAMLHSWKLAPAAHHVLLSILVMTSPHLTSGRQFWLITHMIQSWTTLMAFPHSVSTQRLVPSGNQGYIRNLGCFVFFQLRSVFQATLFRARVCSLYHGFGLFSLIFLKRKGVTVSKVQEKRESIVSVTS